MSDGVSRSLWGDEPEQPGNQQPAPPAARRRNRAGVFGHLLRLFLLLLPALIVYAIMPGAPPAESPQELAKSSAQIAAFTRPAVTAMIAAAGLLVFVFTLPAETRRNRIIRVVIGFMAGGVILAGIAFLAMGVLVPNSTFSERLILPALLVALGLILAIFSPFMPIWLLNVPDNRVWMVLDSGDHLVSYIGPGQRWVRPIDGFAEYTESGIFTIDIDSEDFVSQDYFPFRVRVNVVCLYNPLNAAQKYWITIRDMTRDIMRQALQTEIEFVIRHKLTDELRQQMRDPETFRAVLKTLAMDIREAVEARREMGISLIAHNPINVFLEPTRLVTDSRQRLMSIEAIAVGERTLKEFLELISQGGDVSLLIEPDGQIKLTLGPGPRVDIGDKLRETLITAAQTLADTRRDSLPPGQIASSATAGQLGPGRSSWQQEEASPPAQQAAGEIGQQGGMTQATERPPAPPEQPDETIELQLDEDGVYKPRRNPIIPPDLPDDDP